MNTGTKRKGTGERNSGDIAEKKNSNLGVTRKVET